MKIKLLTAALTILVANSAIAQSAFEGFYGQFGTGYEKSNFSSIATSFLNATYEPVLSGIGTAPSQSASGAPLVIGVGYFHLVQDKYMLGFGVDYSPLSMQSGNFSSTTTNDVDETFQIGGMSYKTSNRLNVFIMPGYAFDEDKLGYLKVGYSTQRLQYIQGPDPLTNLDSGFTASKNVSGYALGLGYKQIITGGIYGFAEGNYYSYGKTTLNGNASAGAISGSPQIVSMSSTSSVSAYNFLVGIGYKF